MAKAKKINKYEVETDLPADGKEWKIMEKNYDSLQQLLSMEEKCRIESNETWDRFSNVRRALIAGDVTDTDWKEKVGEWNRRSLYNAAYPVSPEFDAVNNAFMAEYDRRDDLQQLYRECYAHRYYLHNRYGKQIRRDTHEATPYHQRPDSFRMFREIYDTTEAKKMRELARETPYIEGDLVLLRDPFVGHREHDPYYIHPYSKAGQEGQVTPDRSQPRVATVIAVTEEIENSWRASKGSKILKVVWVGQEDIVNVQEKYVKWHMRPTYKNGLKTRPTE